MVTRRGSTAMTMDEAAESTQRPGKVAAFLPVDNKGNPVEMNGSDENWRMPIGGNGGALMSPHPDDEFDDEREEQTPVDRIVSMLRGVNDGERAYLKVSRIVVGNKVEFCAQYSAADFEAGGLEMIRDQWGPGEYQLILYGTKARVNGEGETVSHFGIRDRTTVMIATPLKPALSAVAQPQSELASLVQQMAANQQEMMRVLSERPAGPDPMTEMTKMFSMMKLMREAMGLDNAPKPTNGLKDIVEAIKQMREVNEELNPGAAPETPMSMVTKMLPLISQGLAARQQQSAQPIAVPVSLPAPQQPAAIPAQSAPQTDMNIIQQKGYLSTLVQMAKAKLPTIEGAKFVYENLHDDLIAALEREDWFELLSGIAGDITAEKDWFMTVRGEALAMFEEPEEGGAATVQPAA